MKNVQVNEICNFFSFIGTHFRLDAGWLNRCFRKVSPKTHRTRDIKPPPGAAILPAPKGQWGHLLEGWGTALAAWSLCLLHVLWGWSMAGPWSFSPASVVGTGSFSLSHPALPGPAGHGAWQRHRTPNVPRASAGGRDPWGRPSAPGWERQSHGHLSTVPTFLRMT